MELLGFIFSAILGFVPMFFLAGIIYWLDRYEKEPKLLLGAVFSWGAIVAVIGALIVQIFLGESVLAVTGSTTLEEITGSSIFAPVTEEFFKGFAILLVFLVFRREFDSTLDGIVYASITALGFAATEDVLYYFGAFGEGGFEGLFTLFFLRFVIFGWQHAFFTSFIGIGLASARLSHNWGIKLIAPIVGFGAAIFTHSLHNSVLTFLSGFGGLAVAVLFAWTGWLLMGGFILYLIIREKRWLAQYLREEVGLGVITPRQYEMATAYFGQTSSRFRALASGRYQKTMRFFQLLGELSHKKRQLATMGDEAGNMQIINKLRNEIFHLSPMV